MNNHAQEPVGRRRRASLAVAATALALVAGIVVPGAAGGQAHAAPATSVAPSASVAPAPRLLKPPVLSGDFTDGHTLVVSPGTWSVTGLHFDYIWYRSNTRLTNITASRYTLTGWDVGMVITVRIRASRTGYAGALVATKTLGPVARPDPSFGVATPDSIYRLGAGGFPRGIFYAENATAPDGQCVVEFLTGPSATSASWSNGSIGQVFADTTNPAYKDILLGTCTAWYAASTAGPAQAAVTHDGTYLVHSQLVPGVYRAHVPSIPGCQWYRLYGANSDHITATGTANPGQTITVTVESSDYAFESEQCGTWTKVG